MTRPGNDILPSSILRGEDLETPLRRVEDGQTANIGVHVLANFGRVCHAGRVVKKVQGAFRATVVPVVTFKPGVSLQAQFI